MSIINITTTFYISSIDQMLDILAAPGADGRCICFLSVSTSYSQSLPAIQQVQPLPLQARKTPVVAPTSHRHASTSELLTAVYSSWRM